MKTQVDALCNVSRHILMVGDKVKPIAGDNDILNHDETAQIVKIWRVTETAQNGDKVTSYHAVLSLADETKAMTYNAETLTLA